MKYIRGIPTEDEFLQIYHNFGLNLTDKFNLNPTEFFDVNILADFIFDECMELFPQHLIRILNKKKLFHDFKKSITQHMVFNTMAADYLKKSGFSELKNTTNEVRTLLRSLTMDKHSVANDTKFIQDARNYLRNLEKNVGKHLELTIDFIDNSRKKGISKSIAPIVFYFFVNYNGYIKFNGNVSRSKYKHIGNYINLFHEFINNYAVEEDIKVLNLYLFERHYNIHLLKTILSVDKTKFIDADNAVKVLCLSSLLPNVVGRIDLVNLLATSLQDIAVGINDDDNGYVDYVSNNLSDRHLEAYWFDRASEIIIHLAFITFPLLEMLHGYLYNEVLKLGFKYDYRKSITTLVPGVDDFISSTTLDNELHYSAFNRIKVNFDHITSAANDIKLSNEEFIDLYKLDKSLKIRSEGTVKNCTPYKTRIAKELIETKMHIKYSTLASVSRITKSFLQDLGIPN